VSRAPSTVTLLSLTSFLSIYIYIYIFSTWIRCITYMDELTICSFQTRPHPPPFPVDWAVGGQVMVDALTTVSPPLPFVSNTRLITTLLTHPHIVWTADHAIDAMRSDNEALVWQMIQHRTPWSTARITLFVTGYERGRVYIFLYGPKVARNINRVILLHIYSNRCR
jgi:hypothetical protein